MTASELKRRYQEARPDEHFFDRATLKFFGDTMSNYGVRDGGAVNGVACWELYRKQPVKGGNQGSAFFDKQTFKAMHRVD